MDSSKRWSMNSRTVCIVAGLIVLCACSAGKQNANQSLGESPVSQADHACRKSSAPELTAAGKLDLGFLKRYGACMRAHGYNDVEVRFIAAPKPHVVTVVNTVIGK